VLSIQFIKFLLVGVLNTGIDFGVLNLLMLSTGITSGIYYSVFKAISFICSVTNSYIWNKKWTFKRGKSLEKKEFSKFFIISLMAFGVNIGVASILVNIIGPVGGISSYVWANISALAATGFTTLINFFGYKYLVFKDKS
jgi:putative flippase GtrA